MIKLNNRYFLMRHGEAISNVRQVVSSWPEPFENPLTESGVLMVQEASEFLKKILLKQERSLDLIFASDLLRTKQTAEIMAKALNVEVKFDKRLREIDFGVKNGTSIAELDIKFKHEGSEDNQRESYQEVLVRVQDFMTDIDGQYRGKNILVVSHKFTLWVLEVWVNNIIVGEDMKTDLLDQGIGKAQIKELN